MSYVNATPKQLALIANLARERGVSIDTSRMSVVDASKQIGALFALPKVVAAPVGAIAITEPGVYINNAGAIFRVQASRDDATRLYAKQLSPIGGERLTDTGDVVRWEFVYVRGGMRALTNARRLTLEEATAFGVKYGVCAVCGKSLADAKSVAAGIGPVCRTRVLERAA